MLNAEERRITMKRTIAFVLGITVMGMTTLLHAESVADKRSLTLDGAKKVIEATAAEAKKVNAPGGSIAVVDDGGNLLALERLDQTFAASANIAIGKARTAALFKKPTKIFEDAIKSGKTSMGRYGGDLHTYSSR